MRLELCASCDFRFMCLCACGFLHKYLSAKVCVVNFLILWCFILFFSHHFCGHDDR